MRHINNYIKFLLLTVFGLAVNSNYTMAQTCATPVITSISNSSPSCEGSTISLTAVGTIGGTSTSYVRMAGIGGNAGNQEFNELFSSGDRPGSIARISNATFDAIFASATTDAGRATLLKAQYDVLMFTWASPNDANITWGLLEAYMNLGGSIFWDGDYANIANLSPYVVGTSAGVSGGCAYTLVTPAPFPTLIANATGCFANDHLYVTSWPAWMHPYITASGFTLAIAGIYPSGNHGRLIIQGPDQDYHACRCASSYPWGGGTEGNQYQMMLNQMDFLAANQGDFTWSGPGGFTATGGNPNISSATTAMAGVYTATLTNTSGGGCYATASTTVTVNPAPTVSVSSGVAICNGSSTTLTASGSSGTTLSWSPSTGLNTTTGSTVTASPSTTTTYVVTATNSGGCPSSATVTVTVNVIDPISGSDFVCLGSTTTLTSSTSGGSWSSSNNAVATVSSGGVVSGVAIGTATITYTVGSCYVTSLISVNPVPASITGTASLCGGGTTTLSNATAGGTWSSSDDAIATVDASSGVVSGVAGGNVTIAYTLPGGCAATYAVTVTGPVAITGSSSVIIGNTTTLSNATSGGTWSSSNTAVATVSSAGVVSGVSLGSATITYAIGGCYVTALINVVPLAYCTALYYDGYGACNYYGLFINDFSFTGEGGNDLLDFGSGCDGTGYQDRRSGVIAPVDVHPGTNYTATITVGSSYYQNVEAWIDFDNSGTFESSESVGGINSVLSSNTFTISIPSGVTAGSFTMRVRGGYNGTTPTYPGLSPCDDYGYGEAHDYDVNIVSPCTAPTITACPGSVTVSSAPGACSANTSYSSATVTGTSPTVTYSAASGSSFNVGTTTVTVNATNSCGSASCTFSVTVTPNTLGVSTSHTNVSCNGESNGTITTTVTGGTGTYFYSWTGGATGANPTGLTAGTYTVTVTDVSCPAATPVSAVVTITEPTLLTASSASGTIRCNGETTTVTVTGSGGTAPYTGDGTFTVGAGTYTYIVSDANGCTASTTITVTEPTLLTASSASGTIRCNGGATTVTVTGSGGTAPYTGDGTFTVGAGTYTYTVNDANGCAASTTITVTEPTLLTASSASGTIRCNGETTTVTVTGSGGTAPYTGDGTFTVGAGTYTYIVSDANGCTASTTIAVTEPTLLTASSASGAIRCNGETTTVTVTGTGGTAPYTGDGTFTVGAGTYTYIVRDANGCAASTTITVTEPTLLTASSSAGTIACNGETTTVTVAGSGGTAPYTGDGTFTVGAGTYTYTVSDANGCTASTTIIVTEPAALALSGTVVHVSCNAGNNGSVTTSVSGGSAPYSYAWSTGAITANITGRTAGTYNVTVTDAHGCMVSASFVITQPSALAAAITVSPVNTVPGQAAYTIFRGYGPQSVTMTATTSGGTPGYAYSWSPAVSCSTPAAAATLVSPTVTTTYTVTVTDAQGCTVRVTKKENVVNVICDDDDDDDDDDDKGKGKDKDKDKGKDKDKKDKRKKKICICHRHHTISVDSSAIAAHLAHGDVLGSCPDDDDDHHGHGNDDDDDDDHGHGHKANDNSAVVSDAIKVYPNPTDGLINVEIPLVNKTAEIAITDITGRVIESRVIADNKGEVIQFNLGNVAKGMYLIKVNAGDAPNVTKIIVR